MKNCWIQVSMAPFGLIFDGNEAKWFGGHVHMPPGNILPYIFIEDGPGTGKSGFLNGFHTIFYVNSLYIPIQIVAIFIPPMVPGYQTLVPDTRYR